MEPLPLFSHIVVRFLSLTDVRLHRISSAAFVHLCSRGVQLDMLKTGGRFHSISYILNNTRKYIFPIFSIIFITYRPFYIYCNYNMVLVLRFFMYASGHVGEKVEALPDFQHI